MLRAACMFLMGITTSAYADYSVNMPRGVSPISQELYQLHMVIFWICVAIGIIVFGVMFYAIYFHRKSRGAVAATFHESLTVEIIWTVIPLLILVIMAIPATKTLLYMENTENPDLTIKVTGYMWRWHYEYIGKDVGFMSSLLTSYEQINNRDTKNKDYLREVDNRLVVPINKKIRLLTTANDVIHSWWVPELAVKKDAIPGFINETWTTILTPGVYTGQCAELCGARHGYMPIVVEAVTEQEFDKWLAAKQGK